MLHAIRNNGEAMRNSFVAMFVSTVDRCIVRYEGIRLQQGQLPAMEEVVVMTVVVLVLVMLLIRQL